ncbi:hypothetical protein [Halalkalicoccus jeotgali]|uniref:Uncharacterized protein n=1 Tax=Halalkalicoccus jeotgali (strain DSM 18796 / CECT 7217 / JCM 14584 / KCTC 4019 / B3) TaxID=795797 RepID=D8J6N5_HALJB|nr:hypothetical protein [Halalkalicoccus jeotgali]ADJ13912.1 hypothetical protein HacjB3_02595 [Halalkalicoccus jeotgali B3]ELY34043.1 hypothetical protein C497_16727 [Halalkalicoccus jeotgali B3]
MADERFGGELDEVRSDERETSSQMNVRGCSALQTEETDRVSLDVMSEKSKSLFVAVSDR